MKLVRPAPIRIGFALAALALLGGANDPKNPTCPAQPDWGPAVAMTLTPRVVGDNQHILVAEGIVDAGLPDRLKAALDKDEQINEIWVRSRGGDARAGNEAGKVIRSFHLFTRIPSGWTCFSACNFVFMGGEFRYVDPGGVFMVHMFTHTGDRETIQLAAEEGTAETVKLIAEIEQSSALLATEDNDFLIRMGVSRDLLTNVMYKQQAVGTDENPSTRYCLTNAETLEYNVANNK